MLLSECWMDNKFGYETDDFTCKSFPRQKSKCIQGGGVFIMIRNVYSEYVTICESIADTFVWIKFSKEFVGINDDLYICCAYLPPINSNYHVLYDSDIFRLLEDSIITYSTKGKIGLIGDMNNRASVNNDFIIDDNFHPSLQDQISGIFSYTSDCSLPTRVNPDNVRNDYG